MAGEANTGEFTGENRNKTYAYAMGWNGQGTPDGKSAFRGGLASPQEMKLHPGQVIYRFGHSNLWDWVNQSSPWWILHQTFLELTITSGEVRAGLVGLARMKLALTPDFGSCNRVFAAIVRRPLRALVGRGVPVWEDPDPAVRATYKLAWRGFVIT